MAEPPSVAGLQPTAVRNHKWPARDSGIYPSSVYDSTATATTAGIGLDCSNPLHKEIQRSRSADGMLVMATTAVQSSSPHSQQKLPDAVSAWSAAQSQVELREACYQRIFPSGNSGDHSSHQVLPSLDDMSPQQYIELTDIAHHLVELNHQRRKQEEASDKGVSIHSTEVDGTVRSQDEAATFVSAAGDVNVNGSLMEGIRKGGEELESQRQALGVVAAQQLGDLCNTYESEPLINGFHCHQGIVQQMETNYHDAGCYLESQIERANTLVRERLLPFRKKRDHPKAATKQLERWYTEHQDADGRAYCSKIERDRLAIECDLQPKQVSTWISNRRNRHAGRK